MGGPGCAVLSVTRSAVPVVDLARRVCPGRPLSAQLGAHGVCFRLHAEEGALWERPTACPRPLSGHEESRGPGGSCASLLWARVFVSQASVRWLVRVTPCHSVGPTCSTSRSTRDGQRLSSPRQGHVLGLRSGSVGPRVPPAAAVTALSAPDVPSACRRLSSRGPSAGGRGHPRAAQQRPRSELGGAPSAHLTSARPCGVSDPPFPALTRVEAHLSPASCGGQAE